MQKYILIDKHEISKRYRQMDKSTHKGIQGHALIIGGSYGKIGSVVLASRAALKSGAGLVTALVPKCGYLILQTSLPEAMVLVSESESKISDITFDFVPKAIGIGIGMGTHKKTQKAFFKFLESHKDPLVIDADALNILSQNPEWFSLLPAQSILTPHKKELERIIGKWDTEDEKTEKVKAFSLKNELIIVVKGAPTQVVFGEKIFENTTGNQALATAGSGDVLTGIITGLLAQSYEPLDAALISVYLHGLTADISSPDMGYESFIASDIINTLGEAFLQSFYIQ